MRRIPVYTSATRAWRSLSGRGSVLLSVAGLALLANGLVVLLQLFQFLIGELLNVNEIVAGGIVGADQLVELEMQGLGITVLGVLDKKDHQKCNNVGNAVDDQLPRIRKVNI